MSSCERWALALLAVGTAAFLPFALNRFVFPKLAVVAAGVLLATLVPARGRLPRSAIWILGLGSLLLLVSALAGAAPKAQILGLPPRYEGIFVLPVYIGAGVAGARLLGVARARGSTAWFLRWLSIAAIAVGIEAVLEATGLRPLASNVARPGSLLGNASDEGAWALLVLGPLAAVALRVGGRLFIAGALAAAATLVCSGSRGALVGAVMLGVVLAALAPRGMQRGLILIGLAAIAAGVFTLPATRARVTGTSPLATQTAAGRELLWGETGRLIANHLLLGVGPSGYLDAIPVYHDRHYERRIGPADPPDSPHDWILQAAGAGGVLLALLAVALAGLTAVRGVRVTRIQATGGEAAAVGGMLAGLAGYGVALLFHLTSPGTTPLAAVLGGALLAEPVSDAARSVSGRTLDTVKVRRYALYGVRALLCAVIVVLVAGAVAELPLRSAIDAAAGGDLSRANHEFMLAHDLRPWDGDIAATAAHAYATLAADGTRPAISAGAPWIKKARAAFPSSVQTLADAATLDLAAGHGDNAAAVLGTALRADPDNPDLWRELALAYRDAGDSRRAAAAAQRAASLQN